MTVSALIITLAEDGPERASALATLTRDPSLLMGQLDGVHLPVVLETSSERDSADAYERLLGVEGVAFVDLVSVHFATDEETE